MQKTMLVMLRSRPSNITELAAAANQGVSEVRRKLFRLVSYGFVTVSCHGTPQEVFHFVRMPTPPKSAEPNCLKKRNVPVMVGDKVYPSLTAAARKAGITTSGAFRRIQRGYKGWKYADDDGVPVVSEGYTKSGPNARCTTR
jgi:hypothetical protein